MERTALTGFAATPNFVLRKIADESILVPVAPGLKNRDCLFVLNATGCAIYSGIRAGHGLEEIERRLLDEFDGVTPEEVRADILDLIEQMVEIEALRDCRAD